MKKEFMNLESRMVIGSTDQTKNLVCNTRETERIQGKLIIIAARESKTKEENQQD